jgi:hypothetical protein
VNRLVWNTATTTILLLTIIPLFSCTKDPSLEETITESADTTETEYDTQNVIIVVIDGARYSETWGDSSHQFVPYMANELAKSGVISTTFSNNGITYTNAGHTAITTGVYQSINNSGLEAPQHPSIFQHWLAANNKDSSNAWIIASKDKLKVLSNCNDTEWNNMSNPATSCGLNGLSSGYRTDSITLDTLLTIMDVHQPQLILVNFREPDFSAHQGSWDNYTQGIIDTDEYIHQINDFIANDPFYTGTTTLFVTNDHGRHIDGASGGFASHGDNCIGCTHLSFYASGPDFKENAVVSIPRSLIDIPATVAELLRFDMPACEGQVMIELFE